MLKRAYIGARIGGVLPLLLIGAAAEADWSAPMAGAEPILPSRFTPMGYEVLPARQRPVQSSPTPPPKIAPKFEPKVEPKFEPVRLETAPEVLAEPPRAPSPRADIPATDEPAVWSLPLVDRRLSQAQKTADIAPDLIDAITRIVPLYDPTRLEGPDAPQVMKVSAGTAVTDSVFADRWRRADPDPNIDAKVTYIALAWRMTPAPCETFSKNRAHGFGEPALTALSKDDCARLAAYQATGFAEAEPVPVVTAAVSVPVFAAPLPGSRLSSRDFWAAQRARVAAIQAHLAQRFHPAGEAAR